MNTGSWHGYYITAYGIAVKHGFSGTELEWLKSLKGEPGDPVICRYNSDENRLEWKYEHDELWRELLSLDELRGEIISQTLTQAQESAKKAENAKDDALLAQAAAESAKAVAQASQKAAESARALAEIAQNEMVNARAEAETIKNAAVTAQRYAESARDTTESYSIQAAEDAEKAAKSAREALLKALDAETQAWLSESWAIGHTGMREGENENNAKYWCENAEEAADRARKQVIKIIRAITATDAEVDDMLNGIFGPNTI